MPDLMSFLRLKNIFGQPPVIGNDLPSQGGYGGNIAQTPDFSQMFGPKQDPYGNVSLGPQTNQTTPAMAMPAPENPDNPGYDVDARMKELYHPETSASDRFEKLSAGYPNREDYHPSMLRRIAAALAAVGPSFSHGHYQYNPTAMQTGMGILDEPFNERVADWKAQIQPAEQAAVNERTTNANQRTNAYQIVSNELKQQAADHKAKLDDQKAEIAQQRANVYEFKAHNPGLKFDVSGTTIKTTDPITGEIKDTGIPTRYMSELDKLNLQHTQKLGEIAATGEQTRETAAEKNWDTRNIPDPNDPTKLIGVRINQVTGEVQPITLNNKPAGPVQNPGTGKNASGLSGTMTAEQLQGIKDKARETLDVLNKLQDEKTGKLNPQYTGAIGSSRLLGGQYIPGTQTRTGEITINRLKSLLIIDLIAEMKKQSRTGATGFGQLNAKELGVIEGAASQLDPTGEEGAFNAELTRIREKLNKILQPASGFENEATKTPAAVDSGKTAKEKIDFYTKQIQQQGSKH